MGIQRMRTVNEVMEIIKAQDPDTSVAPYTIRTLAKTNQIRSFRSGNKLLVNFDDLMRLIGDDDPDSDGEKE